MKKKATNIKVINPVIILLVFVLCTLPGLTGFVKGQTEVTSMKLPAAPQGASVVYDAIHAGNYFFALSYDKLLVFDENGAYHTKYALDENYGKFNPISNASADYNFLCYNENAGVVYAMQPDLSVLAVKADLSAHWSFNPIINQQGATLNDSMHMMNGRMVMRMDNNHNRLYMLVSAMDVHSNPTGQFHSFNHCFLIYTIDLNGNWSLFHEEYIGTDANYYQQINNVIFNEDPLQNNFYLTRLGNPDGIIEVWEISGTNVTKIETIEIKNYPGVETKYQFGKMMSIYDDINYQPALNKVLVFPHKYKTTSSDDFLGKICVIDGDHSSGVNYETIVSPSKKISDAVFLEENEDLVVCFPKSEELSQYTELDDKDLAVFHYNGNSFVQATPFGYATENNTIQLDTYDDNLSIKLLQINDGTALISKKDGLNRFKFMDTDYSTGAIVNGESNFYGNGAKGLSKSCVINSAACRLDFIDNSSGNLMQELSTPLAYPAYYVTANNDGSKLYYYNTLHAHNTGLYIWKDGGGGIVNINNDADENNNIVSAIGDCIYNPYTQQFLISEHTQYNNAPAKIVVINDDEYNTFANQNIPLVHNNQNANFAGEMFIDPNGLLYVMANMRCADPKPKIFVYNASDYSFVSAIEISTAVYEDSAAFYTGYFTYNPHNNDVYASIVPMYYSPDPYHSVKNSMYRNLGYEDYAGKGYFVRLSDANYEEIDFPGKMIVPDRGNIAAESQYDGKLFTIGKKFYVHDYNEGNLSLLPHNEYFNDIAYSPVHDQLIALRDEEDTDREDRKIQIYYIDIDKDGNPVFTKKNPLYFDGQAAGIFYNPIDELVYVYNKMDDEKLGQIQAKLLFFDPSEDSPVFDSIPLGFMSYYPELDHCRDYMSFYFYNIIEPYFNTYNNRLFLPNGGFSTVSMLQLEPRDVLNLRSGITWLSFPRLDRTSGDPEPDEVIGGNNIIPGYDQGSYLRTFSQGQTYESKFNGTLWPSNEIPEITSPEGYKLELFPTSSRYLKMYGEVMDPVTTMDLTASYDNWIGYFLEEPMRVEDAFEGYWDQIYSVKHQDWVIYGLQAPPPNPDGSMDFTLRYGDMVIVDVVSDISDFQWPSGDGAAMKTASEPEYFTYEEKLDYTSFTVDLDPDSLPLEVGVYEDSTCVGASVVEDSIAQINGYTSDSTGYNPEISFVLEYGLKSSQKDRIENYKVFNKRTGRMEQRQIRSGERDKFYWVSLKGDRKENTEPDGSAKAELSVYPNPSSGIFNFDIELKEDAAMVLEIFNCSGKKVASLADGMQNAGYHKLQWQYNGNAGGIYYYRFSIGGYVKNGKLVIIK